MRSFSREPPAQQGGELVGHAAQNRRFENQGFESALFTFAPKGGIMEQVSFHLRFPSLKTALAGAVFAFLRPWPERANFVR